MKLKLFILFLLAGVTRIYAFPELVRHGYTSCTSCHVSPNGGGQLTRYGRSLSRELLSTWGYQGEEDVLHGLIPTGEKFIAGGDVRFLQVYRDTERTRTARFFPMQVAFEATAYPHPNVGVNGVVAYERAKESEGKGGKAISPQHYLIYTPSSNLVLRFGKFQRPFGINSPEHSLASKSRMGIGPGMEKYHIELTQIEDKYEVTVAGTLGSIDRTEADERGLTVRPQVIFGNFKLGVSYAFLKSTDTVKHQFGPFFIWGISNSWTALAEMDWEWKEDSSLFMRTNQNYVKVLHEVYQGINPYILYEMDWNKEGEVVHRPGAGIQLFPRPHFEFNALFQKTLGPSTQNVDQALLVLHYYL